ncbi:hypothetical protein ACIBBE_42830 [Streptomyces sp. NPDC051644]|uniref:WDGH domain-containing protein n=1 Tax=Streptomyces sp. NPDC051644 TaxID=3365666 RepID=UPI0037AE1C99
MTDSIPRVPLDALTKDQLDALYDRVAELEKNAAIGAKVIARGDRETDEILDAGRKFKALAEHHAARAEQAEAALDATYRERAHLVAQLAALHPSHIGHTDPAAPDWAVVIIETPAGQMSWHIAERDMDLFAHVQPTDQNSRHWDGHTTDEKYQRMRQLTDTSPQLQNALYQPQQPTTEEHARNR